MRLLTIDSRFLLAATVVLMSGCSLAPRYERPAVPLASAYPAESGPATNDGAAANIPWQTFFRDPRLQRLIQLALDNNHDLRVAALRVERVRTLYGIQRTALIPSLDATGDFTRQRTPGELTGTGQPITGSTYRVGAEIPSYEIDFFGRVASLRDQVLAQYLATDEARISARISLISTVARQYLTLVATSEQLALARGTLAAADKAHDLTRQAFEAGASSELDLRSAEGQRATYRANVAALDQQVAQARNALVLIVGAPLPDDLPVGGSLTTQALIADLPAGLPSDLLARRPDVRAAERTLQAANANIGVARAAFFPSVKLTAFGGSASTELDGLFESGSGAWSFAPSVTLPLFASGRNRANLDVAWIDQRIEVVRYDQTVQTAFREVADALAVRAAIGRQIAAQEERVTAAERRHALSQQRFESGIDSFLPVLLAQQELFGAQQALIQTRLARLANLTTLFAALGGGWTEPAPGSATGG